MLQQTDTAVVLTRILLDEIIPHLERHPEQVNMDRFACGSTACLLGHTVRYEAFERYIQRWDCYPKIPAPNGFEINWYATAGLVKRALFASALGANRNARLFGDSRCGNLAHRKRTLELHYETLVGNSHAG